VKGLRLLCLQQRRLQLVSKAKEDKINKLYLLPLAGLGAVTIGLPAFFLYRLLNQPSAKPPTPIGTTVTTAPTTPNTPVTVTTSSGVTVPTGISTPTPGSGQSIGQAGQYTTPTTAEGSEVTTIGPFLSIGLARAYASKNLTVSGGITQGSDGYYYIVYSGGPGGTVNISPTQSGIAAPPSATPSPPAVPQYIAPTPDTGYAISSNGFILQSDAQNLANSKGNSQVIQANNFYYVETLLNPPAPPSPQGIFTVTGSDGSTWTGTLSQMLNHFGAATPQIGGGFTGNNGVVYTVVSEQ
jgi:hypothetical protein